MTVPEGTQAHRNDARKFTVLRCAVLTVSDSRTAETDESGRYLREALAAAGHTVLDHGLLPNDEDRVRSQVQAWLGRDDLELIVLTGGTGLGSRDRTIEVVRPLLEKEMPGFGELFRMLSFQDIGPAAMLSRATAGLRAGRIIVSLPGSEKAVRLAMERLLLPELGHLVQQATR